MAGESQQQDSYKSLLDPFRAWSPQEIHDAVDEFLSRSHLHSFEPEVRRGALLAQDPMAFRKWDDLDRHEGKKVYTGTAQCEPQIFADEKHSLCSELGVTATELDRPSPQETLSAEMDRSTDNNSLLAQFQQSWKQYWSQHYMIHALVGCCSLGAAVQGWDESAVNGGKFSGSLQMLA